LTFVFLLKRRRFDLKKLTRATRWPGQNPEPGPWTGPGLKTMHIIVGFVLRDQLLMSLKLTTMESWKR
jgi:hypothetical protein